MLSCLPVELLDLIVKQLKVRDLKRLRQTCKTFNVIASPLVFSRLVLNFDSGRCGLILALLDAIASKKSRLGMCIRTLEIQSFNPPQHKSLQLWQRITKKHEQTSRLIEEHFVAAIPYFVSVRSLSLNLTNMQDMELSCHDRIMMLLGSLPKLAHLSVYMNDDVDSRIPASISKHFHNLQSLHFSGGTSLYGDMPKALMARSPDLSNLIIDGFPSIQHDSSISLAELFSGLPPRRLRTLTLGGLSRHRYDSLISIHRHLQSLTTLVVNPDLTDIPGHFWNALQSSMTRLERLSVHQADSPLLEYLESYSGLTYLSIDLCGFRYNDRRDQDSMADVLYRRVLPKHVDSLQVLHIKTAYEGRWTVGPSQLDAVLACHSLSAFSLGIGPSEANVANKNVITQLLTSVAQGRLPSLRVVKLFLAYPTSARGIGDSVLLMYSSHGVCGHVRLNELVTGFTCKFPGAAMKRLEISTGHIHHGPPALSTFKLRRSKVDGKWRMTLGETSRKIPAFITYHEG
ncbi:hypothetical protein BDZ89DRAFT_347876 [Hymenopellis radicata]|nr:hypothetical protein BDZ89DRAFT_347876 [Hymenopellis radicata]